MAKLSETFAKEESRQMRTFVAVDLTDSTKMKEDQAEAGWLNTYGWFFDMLYEEVAASKADAGRIVKHLGDGVFAVFGDDAAVDAINWAIRVQERMSSARSSNKIKCSCSIGISFGEAVEFDPPSELNSDKDYIGTVVDRAFRLCSAANANAIFVDSDTVAAASMTRVTSKAGASVSPKRPVADYQGPENSVSLKGFSIPVKYHEILWENARFSVKPAYATGVPNRPPTTPQTQSNVLERPASVQMPTGPRPSGPEEWTRGVVDNLGPQFGFIIGPGEESFWFNPVAMYDRELPIRAHDPVWFIPMDALPTGRNRRAVDVLPLGSELRGRLGKVMPDGYGFADFKTTGGRTHSLFVNLGMGSNFKIGDHISVIVGENKKGPVGNNPELLKGTSTSS